MTTAKTEPAKRTAHKIVGPYSLPAAGSCAADCSCGWTGAIHATSGEAITAHASHVAEARET